MIGAVRFALFGLTLMLCTMGHAADWRSYFKTDEQHALELLNNGQPQAAAELFEDSSWRGVSQYRAQQYRDAMQTFAGSETASDLYNHGTAAARAGDYNQAIASLEAASVIEPDNDQIRHNLDIARKLSELAKGNREQSDDKQESEPENQDQEEDQNQDGQQQQDGSSDDPQESQQSTQADSGQSSEQSTDESEQTADTGQQNSSQDRSADATDSKPETQDAEALRDLMQQQQAESVEDPLKSPAQVQAEVQVSVSEDDQASEQWLRRIPDDATQLLRNKIRLNHMIEYRAVKDMQEPW